MYVQCLPLDGKFQKNGTALLMICARTLAENVGGAYTRRGAYMWDTTVSSPFFST